MLYKSAMRAACLVTVKHPAGPAVAAAGDRGSSSGSRSNRAGGHAAGGRPAPPASVSFGSGTFISFIYLSLGENSSVLQTSRSDRFIILQTRHATMKVERSRVGPMHEILIAG